MNRLIFGLLFFMSSALILNAQPKFVIVGGEEHNWGEVKAGKTPLKASATFKNEGTEKLVIVRVKPSCGCTAAKPEKDTLQPGESTKMNFELNVGNNSGMLTKSINIETNDPARKNVSYKIKANIIRDIIIKPSQSMSFRGLNVGKEASQKVIIKNNSDKPIKFSDVKVQPEIITITTPTSFSLAPGKEIEIVGKVTPKESGNKSGRIHIVTDNPDTPALDIYVYTYCEPSPVINNGSK